MSKRFLAFVVVLLPFSLCAQPRIGAIDSLLRQYTLAIEPENTQFKSSECDFIISSCSDSLEKQEAALWLYSHYLDSPIMGEEAVAVHIYDKWFAPGTVAMKNEVDLLNASVYAEFNRQSLVGCQVPRLTMTSSDGSQVSFPRPGRRTVLYFYDTSCPKCSMSSILLKYVLGEGGYDVDFVAVYVGSEEDEWEKYRQSALDISGVNVFHLWDPSIDSDYQRVYGVLSTPSLFYISAGGVVLGRKLDAEALKKILMLEDFSVALDELCPVGSKLPKMRLCGRNIRRYEYLVFYSPDCSRCQAQLEAMSKALPGRTKVLRIDVDALLKDDPEAASKVFDTFDLSVLPFILRTDRRGTVLEKYLSF